MNHTTVFVGLDVHKDSITAACVDSVHEAPVINLGTVGTQQYAIDRLLKRSGDRSARARHCLAGTDPLAS